MASHAIITTWFPDIRDRLTAHPYLINDMQVPCLLCYKTTTLDTEAERTPTVCPGLVVLPCGHCVGAGCYIKYTKEQEELNKNVCPICGTGLLHRAQSCAHLVEPFPFRDLDDLRSIPPCTNEEADPPNQISQWCMPCKYTQYLSNLGEEFYLNMPERLRVLVDNMLMFVLKTDCRRTFNIICSMLPPEEPDLGEYVRLNGPMKGLEEDMMTVTDAYEPSAKFQCTLMNILRRPVISHWDEARNLWEPRVVGVDLGIWTNGLALEEMEELTEFFETIHERSEQYQELLRELPRQIVEETRRAADRWRIRFPTPESDAESIEIDLNARQVDFTPRDEANMPNDTSADRPDEMDEVEEEEEEEYPDGMEEEMPDEYAEGQNFEIYEDSPDDDGDSPMGGQ